MQSLKFEARELTPYARYVACGEFQTGSTYFMVNYVDDDMLILVVQTLVFIGRDLNPDDVGQAYFQDIKSYRKGVRHDSRDAGSDGFFLTGSEKTAHFFEFESALEELMRCSLRRKARSQAPKS